MMSEETDPGGFHPASSIDRRLVVAHALLVLVDGNNLRFSCQSANLLIRRRDLSGGCPQCGVFRMIVDGHIDFRPTPVECKVEANGRVSESTAIELTALSVDADDV
jgi:hypothetical protein